ncbi:hypothetical protein F8M41_018992 [Gigaspora margarita]|uniref:Uncharacterized protein n=1 Tax=Gigaspora margarita TaxID=4874 RepID=A0A8H4B2E9_GIGMA|nr:hypothetical protein F8M41_018992 [Gigaspora margarita]
MEGPVTKIIDLYYVSEELVNGAEIGLEEEEFDLELLFQNLATEFEAVDKKKVEMDKYEDERKEVEKDLPNNRIGVVEIGSANEMNMVGPCYDKPNENDNEEYDNDETIVDEDEGEKEKDVTKPTENKETKGPTEKEHDEIVEASYVGDHYQKEIGEEKDENKGAIKREAPTVFLVQF